MAAAVLHLCSLRDRCAPLRCRSHDSTTKGIPWRTEGIVKRGSKYAVVIELGPDLVTGKRRKKWHSGYRTLKEAKAARGELLSQLATMSYVEPTNVTLGVYLEEWLRVIEPTIKPSTHYSYGRNMRLHVLPTLGATPLAQVDAMKLNALYAQLLLSGKKNGKPGGLSPRSVSYVHTILHRALKDAVRWGKLIRNAADLADPPKKSASTRPPMVTWDADSVRDFMAQFDRRVKRWGLPKITLHGLRHTWATLALQADVHPRVVQERLGHSHVGVTLAIYSHVTPTMQADAAQRVAQLFASGR